MGLVLESGKFEVLTDILGDEDHLGDMDFKVAGTSDGVTALQMDIKIEGITREIMKVALEPRAHHARLHILGEMNKVISAPRPQMSEWAPTIITIKIDPEKIPRSHRQGWCGDPCDHRRDRHHDRHRERRHGEDRVGEWPRPAAKAQRRIELITSEVEVGAVYEGKVVRLMDFGRRSCRSCWQGRPGAHLADLEERVERVSGQAQGGRRGARPRCSRLTGRVAGLSMRNVDSWWLPLPLRRQRSPERAWRESNPGRAAILCRWRPHGPGRGG